MKKSNALMLSYIIFLLITVVVNLVWKWEGLGQIALAASAAGLFFAFADLAGWYLSCALPYAELFLDDAVSIKENLHGLAKVRNEAKDNIYKAISLVQPYLDGRPKLNKIVQDCTELRNEVEGKVLSLSAVEKKAELLREQAEKYVTSIKRYRVFELGLACIGFLAFFILTVFEAAIKTIAPYEALVTVFAFIIIMLCYYLRDTVEEKMKKDCAELEAETKERKEETIDTQEVEYSRLLLEKMQELAKKISKSNSKKEGSENGQVEDALGE